MATNLGPIGTGIRLAIDERGFRTYVVPFKVKVNPSTEGPYSALGASGLPAVGSSWNTLFSGDADTHAWCRPTKEVTPLDNQREGVSPEFYIVTCTFSNQPQERNSDRCHTSETASPLQEPRKINIQYQPYTEEASHDRYGRRITSSSHEPIHGPVNEWELHQAVVTITENVADSQLSLMEQMKDSVNAIAMWGFPPRTIKFNPVSVERQFYKNCLVYYVRTIVFKVKYRRLDGVISDSSTTGTAIDLLPPTSAYESWDRDTWDEGTKVLRGYWSDASAAVGTSAGFRTHWTLSDIDGMAPDKDNPQHFIRFKDWNGENQRTLLDGEGEPAFTKSIEYKWWYLLEPSFVDGGGPIFRVFKAPCAAALAAARPGFDLLYGPFDDEASAGATGSPIFDCPDGLSSVGVVRIEKYGGSDFRLLGIPTDFSLL